MYTAYPPGAAGAIVASGGTGAAAEGSAAAVNYYSTSAWYTRNQSTLEASSPPGASLHPSHPSFVPGMDFGYPPPLPPTSSELSHHYSPSAHPYDPRHWPNNWSSTFNDLANYYNLSQQGPSYRSTGHSTGSSGFPPFTAERNESFHAAHQQPHQNRYFMRDMTTAMEEQDGLKTSFGMNNNNNNSIRK